jgi:general stress protein 26
MNQSELKNSCLNIIKNAPFVVLSTINEDGFPESRAMLNLKVEDGFTIWFTTNTSSRKIQQIKNNKKASAYFTLHQEWKGVTIEGELEIIEDMETKKKIWQPGWEMYYPKGVEDPDNAIVKLNPKKVRLYGDLKKHSFDV